jgi:hypothetical protein
LDQYDDAPGEDEACQFAWVNPQYFKTMGIPLTAGRDFKEIDSAGAPRILVLNEDFVQKCFKTNENPIGRTVRSLREPNYPETLYEIVGVVKSTNHSNTSRTAGAGGVRSRSTTSEHLCCRDNRGTV